MPSLTMDTGEIRLAVNEDAQRVICFNPADVGFVRRFYALLTTLEAKEKEYQERLQELAADESQDAHGLPRSLAAQLQLLEEICAFLREQIDLVFGAGTSETVFGQTNTLNMFEQFFLGITPYVQQAREPKLAKYLPDKQAVMRQ